jgi:hypothetical protein
MVANFTDKRKHLSSSYQTRSRGGEDFPKGEHFQPGNFSSQREEKR